MLTKETAAQGIKSCWSELDRVLLKFFELTFRCWNACLRLIAYRPPIPMPNRPTRTHQPPYSRQHFYPWSWSAFAVFNFFSFPSFINSLTATLWPSVSALIMSRTIQNGGQNKRKGSKRNNLGRREFLPAVPPDDQYVLVRVESD